MISKRYCVLYDKCEDYHWIRINIFANENVTTRWGARNKDLDLEKDKKARKIMHELKINGCAICGYDKCDAALDFHHVNSKNKKFQILARATTKPPLIFVEELNKCILLCCRCHRELHDKEKKENVFFNKSNIK